jgi:hypothetical protein
MHVPEAQRPFLDSVQEALRRYDEQLRDINHKVCSPVGSTLASQLISCRFGRILNLPTKNTRRTITSVGSSTASNRVAIKFAPRLTVSRRLLRLSLLTEVADVLLCTTRNMVRSFGSTQKQAQYILTQGRCSPWHWSCLRP